MSVVTVIKHIRDHLRSSGKKPATLARESGLHANALRDVFAEDWNPNAVTLKKIEAAIARSPDFGTNAAKAASVPNHPKGAAAHPTPAPDSEAA